jgi:hypothetical protein
MSIFSEITGGLKDLLGVSEPKQDSSSTSDYFARHVPDDRNIVQEIVGDVLTGAGYAGDVIADAVPHNARELAYDVTAATIAEPIGIVSPGGEAKMKDYLQRSWGVYKYEDEQPTGNWARHLKRWEEDWFKGPAPGEAPFVYRDRDGHESPVINPNLIDSVQDATNRVFDSRPVKVNPNPISKSKPSKARSKKKKFGSRQRNRNVSVTVR